MDAQVDGLAPLSTQETNINYAEQANNARLISYTKGTAPTNTATFQDVPLGQEIPLLTLIEVPTNSSMDAIAATQLSAGKTLVFKNKVFVNGAETMVAGFR